MAKKLELVVPHYKEPFEDCKFLFDSIQLQHGIDFNDISVLVVNDGDAVVWDESVFAPYTYEIKYVVKPHGGLSDTRNYGIENGDSEYLMFCDCDDGFLNNYGLHLVLGAIQEGFDFFYSSFVEEQPNDSGGWVICRRDHNIVLVPGKCYRRQFLIDKNIRFDTEMYFSEDAIFNKVAYCEADEKKEVNTPFYLWAWHDNSTVRKDRETLVLREYGQVMKMRSKTCEELDKRGFIDEYFDTVCRTIFDSYYDFNEPLFLKPEYKDWVKSAEKEFKKFYKKFAKSFYECDSERVRKAMAQSRIAAYENGLIMEKTDFMSWIKHIKNDVK